MVIFGSIVLHPLVINLGYSHPAVNVARHTGVRGCAARVSGIRFLDFRVCGKSLRHEITTTVLLNSDFASRFLIHRISNSNRRATYHSAGTEKNFNSLGT